MCIDTSSLKFRFLSKVCSSQHLRSDQLSLANVPNLWEMLHLCLRLGYPTWLGTKTGKRPGHFAGWCEYCTHTHWSPVVQFCKTTCHSWKTLCDVFVFVLLGVCETVAVRWKEIQLLECVVSVQLFKLKAWKGIFSWLCGIYSFRNWLLCHELCKHVF